MDRAELERRLVAKRIPADAYTLWGSDRDNTLNLEQRGNGFIVYYSERGTRHSSRSFGSEADACNYFLETLVDSFPAR
jgi:hypothetical protein